MGAGWSVVTQFGKNRSGNQPPVGTVTYAEPISVEESTPPLVNRGLAALRLSHRTQDRKDHLPSRSAGVELLGERNELELQAHQKCSKSVLRRALEEGLPNGLQGQTMQARSRPIRGPTNMNEGNAKKGVSVGRHKRQCGICAHPQKEQIEADFVSWRSASSIAQEYGLADRSSVYRHAHALGLFATRQRNVRAALERIIEQAGEVEVSASAVVAAIQAYSKINAQGQWVDRSERVNLNDLCDRMTGEELETYARDGKLPDWFAQTAKAPAGSLKSEEAAAEALGGFNEPTSKPRIKGVVKERILSAAGRAAIAKAAKKRWAKVRAHAVKVAG
jgi:hypothetical protein